MKADLHCHSKYSPRPSVWLLQKIGCSESYTDPHQLYAVAKSRGMSFVTITDHNTIDGCLEIADRPDTFISEELTSYFPRDNCKVHVLVYGIDEAIHSDVSELRQNIFELVPYLRERGIVHALAHPFHSVNDRLTLDHFEQALLLFRHFELNGDQSADVNLRLRWILEHLRREDIERLSEKHGIEPAHDEPWRKVLVAGSDDHASLDLGLQYTRVEGASSVAEFIEGVDKGRCVPYGQDASPRSTALKIYSIAYQFYNDRTNMLRWAKNDLIVRFFNRVLLGQSERARAGLLSRFDFPWKTLLNVRGRITGRKTLFDLLRTEAEAQIRKDPQLIELVSEERASMVDLGRVWFEFINRVSNKVLTHFGNHCLDRLFGAHIFDLFHSIGSACALYTLLAPYFYSYSRYSREDVFCRQAARAFGADERGGDPNGEGERVAFFTDTPEDLSLLRAGIIPALADGNAEATVITCVDHPVDIDGPETVKVFEPVGQYEIPDYPGMRLSYPPFLEMFEYCYNRRFTRIVVGTPGTVGVSAVGIAKVLRQPVAAVYDGLFPDFARVLEREADIEDLVWKALVWFYDQSDAIYTPSHGAADELIAKGLSPGKCQPAPDRSRVLTRLKSVAAQVASRGHSDTAEDSETGLVRVG